MMESSNGRRRPYENGKRYSNGCYVCGSHGIYRLCGGNGVDSGSLYAIVVHGEDGIMENIKVLTIEDDEG